MGAFLCHLGYKSKNRVQSFDQENGSVTIINLERSQDKNKLNPKTFGGIVLLSFALFLLITNFILRKKIETQVAIELTGQEELIVQHIKDGLSNKEIASKLFISLSTVKTHINNIYKKLGIKSRSELQNRNN